MSEAATPLPTAREWIGEASFPWPTVDALVEGERVSACYCVESKQLGTTKGGKPYLRIQLCDRGGNIEARVWDDANTVDAAVVEGGFVGVRGRVESFRGERQLKVEEIAPIAVEANELELFLPRTPFALDALEAELERLVASIEDAALRTLVGRLTGRETETGRAYRRATAAKKNHHAYVGGLLEHSVSLAQNCDYMARHYGARIDRDLLVAGALVHDIGKIREIDVSGGFPYTDEGKLLGHIVLGIEIVREAARDVPALSEERLTLLLHLVASHQGRYEWQSPRIPMLLEALILHYVDDLDAKMNQATVLVDSVEKGWTRYDPSFGRDFLRHRGGEDSELPEPAPASVREAPAIDPFGDPLDEEFGATVEVASSEPEGAEPIEAVERAEVTLEDGALEDDAEEPPREAGEEAPAESGRSGGGLSFSPDTLDLFGG